MLESFDRSLIARHCRVYSRTVRSLTAVMGPRAYEVGTRHSFRRCTSHRWPLDVSVAVWALSALLPPDRSTTLWFTSHPMGLVTGSPNMSRKVDWRRVSSWARASRRLTRKASAASRIPAIRFCSSRGRKGDPPSSPRTCLHQYVFSASPTPGYRFAVRRPTSASLNAEPVVCSDSDILDSSTKGILTSTLVVSGGHVISIASK